MLHSPKDEDTIDTPRLYYGDNIRLKVVYHSNSRSSMPICCAGNIFTPGR